MSSILNIFKKYPRLSYFLVFLASAIFFGILQWEPTFLDPDSFYHAKIAELMLRDGLIIKNFPWLPFTNFNAIYTDHHFIYHIILLPFVYFFKPLIGVKIAATLLNSIFVLLFYGFLKQQKAPYPLFFVFLLLSSSPFIFRVGLVKGVIISLIIIILLLRFLLKRNLLAIFILSFIYVWSYGGWPLAPTICLLLYISSSISEYLFGKKIKKILLSAEWMPFVISLAGAIAGFIINPYFPKNLAFNWLQIIQIALVNYQSKIGVGAEWYGFNFAELISYSGSMLLAGGLAILSFLLAIFKKIRPDKKVIKETFFFFLLTSTFFILTLKSNRNVEYFFPFALLFSAFFLKYFFTREVRQSLTFNLRATLKYQTLYYGFLAYLIIALSLGFIFNFLELKFKFSKGFSFEKYKSAMDVARQNSDNGDIIFHSDWSDWPILFYHNERNYYITGLDATFLYKANKELYKKWQDIAWGEFAGDPYETIKLDFDAKIIFIADNDIELIDKYFKDDPRYKLLYDGEGRMYLVN